MDATVDYTDLTSSEEQPTWPRLFAAEKLAEFERLGSPWTSHRKIAAQIHVPPRTLHHWVQQKRASIRNSSWPPSVAQFLQSPDGVCFLHQLSTAVDLVFLQANDCGIRSVCSFLELSGLDEFMASSYGARQAAAEEMESLLIAFGEQEDQRLGAQMPPREISVCEDETFHPQICLVGIEPVSNFLLLEQYECQRDAETWNRCLDERLAGLPVTVCQVTSDQAKAILTHTETHLGAHHSPDLFHVQQDTVHATSLALAAQTRRAEEELKKARQKTADLVAQRDACREECPETSHGELLEGQRQQAEAEELTARRRAEECRDRQQRAAAARRGLGRDYHPFDLDTGRPLTEQEVTQRLAGHFDTLDQVAAEAGLSPHARDKLAKARRVLDGLQATVAFFWAVITARLEAWKLSEAVQQCLREQLIPGYYLGRAAEKAATAQERQRLRELSQEILARARSPNGPWGMLNLNMQAELERKARDCADLFQRSSSCVEGRNGQLSLKHHALHQLTKRKLKALTVLHNYFVQRADGSTAAERFYGRAPRDLFAWLLEHVSLPARPRVARDVA
jgi:hypothetical protein